MHKFKFAFLTLPMLFASLAHAQTAGTITFTAKQSTATGSLAPVLTWSTTPVASSCTASGGWSGTKFASGTETLATITTSKSYTLTCRWGGGSATVRWTAPTTNTDTSALTNLAGFKVMFGTSSSALSQTLAVNSKTATSATISALASGTWYFAVRAVNASGTESVNSAVSSKVITSATAAKTVNITITGAPPTNPTSTLKVTNSAVFDVVRDSGGVRQLGKQVGTIAVGKPCDSTYRIWTTHYRVNRSDVTITTTPRSTNLVAKCAKS